MKEMTSSTPLELLNSEKLTYISAPMVRYSKIPFRQLVRQYGVDIAYTPMIMADSFVNSKKARNVEFEFCKEDGPLVVQFGTKSPSQLAEASQHVYGHCDGVDINCGCPQRWAYNDGIGACMIDKPDLISEMIKETRSRINDPSFSISVKIRLHSDIRKTVALARQMEATGATWLTVHGRTARQRNQPVNLEAIKTIRDSLPHHFPLVANGDVNSLDIANSIAETTGVNGVMTARALLSNPALFKGFSQTPVECVNKYIEYSAKYGTVYQVFQHHITAMLDCHVSRFERRRIHAIESTVSLIDHLRTDVLKSSLS